MRHSVNKKLFAAAKKRLVGGVDSPVRSFGYVGLEPPVIKAGRGAYLYDYDGNRYLDFVLSWGAAILGHAHPEVREEISKTVREGFNFGATTKPEIELAAIISRAIPCIEKIRFTNSGTEAVMGALRLARGFTGRDLILTFEHEYHGHADHLLAKAGSGLATLGIPLSRGVPASLIKDTIVAPSRDPETIGRIFRKSGKRIAAVIVEPVGGNYGLTPPDPEFLARLRALTGKYGSLLIFDEVITGFRFHYGSAADLFGIRPDLITLGKIIGGGLPAGAYGGRDEIMARLAPSGDVYQASTFAGNPVVMRAGARTLKVLAAHSGGYRRMAGLTGQLVKGIRRAAQRCGEPLQVASYASMFSLRFPERRKFSRFYRLLLENGVYLAPSEFEVNFLSFAHTHKDVEKTLGVLDRKGIFG